MKILSVLLLSVFLLIGCKEGPPPKYKIGDGVMVVGKIEGTIIQTRGWVGSGKETDDYKVMIGNSVAEWYDEEQVMLK